MKTWEVWSEGYRATGEHGTATKHGEVEAETFKEACDKVFNKRVHKVYYNPENLTYWACRLFDNEADARKAFG